MRQGCEEMVCNGGLSNSTKLCDFYKGRLCCCTTQKKRSVAIAEFPYKKVYIDVKIIFSTAHLLR